MIMSSKFADLMIKAIAIVSACYFAIRAAYSSFSQQGKLYLSKIMGMILILNIFIIPKTSITIKDHVTKQIDTVDNLPYGFAIPVGILENFGNILSASFEQAFTGSNNMDYRNYGMVFGPRLIKESREWKIRNPEFVNNMNNFIKRCIIIDTTIGGKYSIKELLESENIWELIKSRSSKIRRVGIRSFGSYKLYSCKEAATDIFPEYFRNEIEETLLRYASSLYSKAGGEANIFASRSQEASSNFFKRNISEIFSNYLGSALSAEDNLRQHMIINSLSGFADNYGYTRASMTQDANWIISGDIASIYLPILLTVMKVLIYASFIFIVPLLLIDFGIKKYINYLSIIISLQLWPSLNAILNLFIDLYCTEEMRDIAASVGGFSSYATIGYFTDKIVAVASGLEIIIPFLAFSIVSGGVSGFIHLANSISSATSNASNIASNEVATGNRGFDNYSSANLQFANRSALKTDLNFSHKEGMKEWQHLDGTMERAFRNGGHFLQSGLGLNISSGSSKRNIRSAAIEHISKDVTDSTSELKNSSTLFRDAKYESVNKVSSLLAQLAQRASYGIDIDYSKVKESSDSIQSLVSDTKTIKKSTGTTWDKAAQIAFRGSFGGGIFGASAAIDYSTSMAYNSYSSKSTDIQNTEEHNKRKEASNIVRALSSKHFARSNNIDLSYSDDIRKSLEKQKVLEKQVLTQKENVKRYNDAFAKITSLEASKELDMYDEFQENIAEAFDISNKDAHLMIESNDPRIEKIWDKMVENFVSEFMLQKVDKAREDKKG